MQHLLPVLPTRTEEEIHGHEEWYQEYLFLNETKKESIKRWRNKREVSSDQGTVTSIILVCSYQ